MAGDTRPTVLVLLGCFSRGVEATGPNQSMIGMARALSHRYRFRVVGAASPGDRPGEWGEVSGIEQMPLELGWLGARGLKRALSKTPHDVLVTNSFFDRNFSVPMLLMRRFGLVPARPVLLAPRGEFSAGSLALSPRRKALHLGFAKALDLLRGVSLQATTEGEAEEIRSALGQGLEVYVTPNIRHLAPVPPHVPRAPGEPLRVAFLSRIDRKKNLLFALETLARAEVPIEFRIFGPVTHQAYWASCSSLIERLPAHVQVSYAGPIPQSQVPAALAAQDLFFLPTLGENYGHAIIDALLAGTPVLLSDQTPWRHLAAEGAGLDLPLDRPQAFVEAIRDAHLRTGEAYLKTRTAARDYAEKMLTAADGPSMLEACLDALIASSESADAAL